MSLKPTPAGTPTVGTPRNSPRPSPHPTPKRGQNAASYQDFNADGILEEYKKVQESTKPLLNLAIVGHVDAGKSTLMGHLLFKLGLVSKKAIHRYETDSKNIGKASFAFAWVLDETEEERSRGVTMDVAENRFETPNRIVNLLDAPGHKDFIPKMIIGASQADVALLVVDATKGEFETGFEAGGQTREHTMLVRSLGVSQLGVVVNKLDTCDWSQDRFKEICEKLGYFLKQAGFKDNDVVYVPCSGLTGENLNSQDPKSPLYSWYKGPTLLEVIDKFRPPERPIAKPFRMRINDVYKGMSAGINVAGKIESGAVQVGQKCAILPSTETCTIRSITINEESETQAFAGNSVILTLHGCEPNNIAIGDVVCDAQFPAPVTSRFEARIVIFNNIEIPITKGFPVVIHIQSFVEQATIKKLVAQLSRSSGEVVKKKPRCLSKNTNGIVEIEVTKPVCVELYKENKDLGRFMIRSAGSTIAAGLITKIITKT